MKVTFSKYSRALVFCRGKGSRCNEGCPIAKERTATMTCSMVKYMMKSLGKDYLSFPLFTLKDVLMHDPLLMFLESGVSQK